MKTKALRFGLTALNRSGATAALGPHLQGQGAIFMLHHVRPEQRKGFAPNRLLEITPEFLDATCREVIRAGFDILSLDEACARLQGQESSRRPFACFTFDDGYRDNRDFALPVMKRHGVPFTVYVASDFADGRGFLWWLVLEEVIRVSGQISVVIDGHFQRLNCDTDHAKLRAWSRLYWWLRTMPEEDAREIVSSLAARAGVDILSPCRELAMSWPEIAQLACDPLVTIGAHSISHCALGSLDVSRMRAEIKGSVMRIEQELGVPCRHFCYPYGDDASAGEREFRAAAELGLASAVTTRKGFVSASHACAPTSLPRVSLNGEFQSIDCLRALLSGIPFALWRGLEPAMARPRHSVAKDRASVQAVASA